MHESIITNRQRKAAYVGLRRENLKLQRQRERTTDPVRTSNLDERIRRLDDQMDELERTTCREAFIPSLEKPHASRDARGDARDA